LSAACIFLCAATVCASYPKIMKNWNKAYDDQFAEIWVNRKGYQDVTYLIGAAPYGFRHYVPMVSGYDPTYLDRAILYNPDVLCNFPEVFWLWGTSWSEEDFAEASNSAEAQGYTIEVIMDKGRAGRLVKCYKGG